MGSLLCVVLSLVVSLWSVRVADLFAYAAYGLIAVLLLRVCWHGLSGQAEASATEDVARETEARPAGPLEMPFWAALVVTVGMFYWLYVAQMFVIVDPNAESMAGVLPAAHAERARAAGIPLQDYMRQDASLQNHKEQDPVCTVIEPGKRFIWEWMIITQPTLILFTLPFVKVAGVGYQTIAWYSTFFGVLACVGTGLLAWRMFGRWCGLMAVALMAGSLGWLIHVRVGYPQVMPAAFLIVLLAWCLYGHGRGHGRWTLAAAGGTLALMYLTGWIVFAFGGLMAAGAPWVGRREKIGRLFANGLWLGGVTVLVAALLAAAYAAYYRFPAMEVHRGIFENYLSRSQQGEPGLLQMTAAQKTAYAFKCLFLDSRTYDGHVDKYLEGAPAVPWVLSGFLALGLFYAIRARGVNDRLLLVWLLAVFGVQGLFFVFGHRYAVLGLPAMSILAARAAVALGGDLQRWKGAKAARAYSAILAAALVVTLVVTHQQYYGRYLHHKEPNLEADRMRGHHGFVQWVKQTGAPEDTLVVLGDVIMFPATIFVFDTFDQPYRFVYFSNYFRTGASPDLVRQWEADHLAKYRRVVYAFSTMLLGTGQPDAFQNDWRPFVAAFPDRKPAWTYSYDGRLLMVAFEARRAP